MVANIEKSVLPEIKKIISCQKLQFIKVYARKATAGYVYWVHYQVKQLGNSKIGTLMLFETDNSLQLIDVMPGHHLGIQIIPHQQALMIFIVQILLYLWYVLFQMSDSDRNDRNQSKTISTFNQENGNKNPETKESLMRRQHSRFIKLLKSVI